MVVSGSVLPGLVAVLVIVLGLWRWASHPASRRRSLPGSLERLHRRRPASGLLLRRDQLDLLIATSDADAAAAIARHGLAGPLPGLAALLGPDAPRETRAATLAWLLARRDDGLLHADALPLIEGCLADGVRPAAAIRLLLDRADHAGRRRLFDRLWSITQSGQPRWGDVDDVFFSALVVCAPAPDLLAILLDAVDDPAFGRGLVQAIGEHPDAYLVPALERWSQAHPAGVNQRLARCALAACRQRLV